MSVASIAVSLVAVSIYAVDMDRNPEAPCGADYGHCSGKYYAMVGTTFILCQYY